MRWLGHHGLGFLVLLSTLEAARFVPFSERNCQHYTGCARRATYGSTEFKVPRFCAQHREQEHVDLNRKRCRHPEGCESFATFASSPSDTSTRFCKEHCMGSLVRLRGAECHHPECNVSASFGPEGRSPLFCKSHKEIGHVDVRHRKCRDSDCWRRAYYGPYGGSAASCRQHRKEGEIDLSSRRCQAEEGPCLHQPNFGSLSDGKKRFCSKHKREADVDLRFSPVRARDCSPVCSETAGSSDSQSERPPKKAAAARLRKDDEGLGEARKGKLKVDAGLKSLERERGGQRVWGSREKRERGAMDVEASMAEGELWPLPLQPPPPLKAREAVGDVVVAR